MPTSDAAAARAGRRPFLRVADARRLGVVAAAGALVFVAGCGGHDGPEVDLATAPEGYEASTQFLRSVVDNTEAEKHRYEMSMSMNVEGGGQSIDVDVTMMTGEQDGEFYSASTDLGETLEATAEQTGQTVPSELTGEDAVIEVAGDSSSVYIYAPFVADAGSALAQLGAANPLYDVYAQLGDKWGFVDLTVADETVSAQAASGSNGFDPRALVDAIVAAGTVEELGQEEIDGSTVTGLAAETTLGEMLEAQGMDSGDFAEQLGAGTGVPERMLEAIANVDLPIEVWMDEGGKVRQISFAFTKDMMVDVVEAAGEDAGQFEDQVDEFEMEFTVDYSDYGDDSIEIELPDRAEAVDITEDYADALGV